MRVVAVTGAASGIGLKLAKRLREAGDLVVAVDLDRQKLLSVLGEEGPRLMLRALNVADSGGWARLVTEVVGAHGRLDVLVNCAGVLVAGPVEALTPLEIDRVVDTNVKGVCFGTQAAAAQMVRQGSGHIVNIASLAGLAPVPGLTLYSASKFAVRGFSLGAAVELEPKGVRVTCVCPDGVRTPMLGNNLHNDHLSLVFSGGALLDSEEVASAVLGALDGGRSVELRLPVSRGMLAVTLGAFPSSLGWLFRRLAEKGRKSQAAARTGLDFQG